MKPNRKIILSQDSHKGRKVILVKFDYDKELISKLRGTKGAKWSRSKRCWYNNTDDFNLKYF